MRCLRNVSEEKVSDCCATYKHKLTNCACSFSNKKKTTHISIRFHPQNVLGIRNFADSLGHAQLVASADKFINYEFTSISHSDEFLQLPCRDLIAIIKRDELNCTSEEVVFDAAMRWVKHEPERDNILPEVLSYIRLPSLSPQFLADNVATEELIRTNHKCRDLLDEAKDFHLMPERRELLQSYRTRPRGNDFVRGFIYAVSFFLFVFCFLLLRVISIVLDVIITVRRRRFVVVDFLSIGRWADSRKTATLCRRLRSSIQKLMSGAWAKR